MRRKLFRSLFGFGMLCILLVTTLFSSIIYNAWEEDFHQALQAEVATIAAYSEIQPLSKDVLQQIGNRTGGMLRLTWISPDGKVLFDSNSDAAKMENHLARPEVKQALQSGEGRSIRDSSTLQQTNYYEALRLHDGSVLRVAKVGKNIYSMLFAIVPGMSILLVGMTVLCFYMAKRLTQNLVDPVEKAIQQWVRGDRKENIVGFSTEYDEIGPLIALLDTQQAFIDASVSTIEEERNTLRSMMEDLNEGILLADCDGKVLAYNERIKQFFHMDRDQSLEGVSLHELSHEANWLNQVKRAAEEGMPGWYQYESGGRYFKVMFNVMEAEERKGRILVIVMDETETYVAQKRRYEFTSNVSHELKTPLTTISGYAEVLANELYRKKSDVKELGKHIYGAAQHMLELIESIMHLSKVEENKMDIPFEELSIYQLAEEAWKRLDRKHDGRNISFSIFGDVMVYGNKKLLQEVFTNLLDNAIKFGGEDNQITVTANKKNNLAIIAIADQGEGISGDKISRVFERFYQTDESRNSKREGSGIGLSLVKHILEIHHGTIKVDSKMGEGSTFTITLPKGQD